MPEKDHFMKNLLRSLILVLIVQGASFIYLVGVVMNQQNTNTKNIDRLLDMNHTLVSIDTQTTLMASSMLKLADTVTTVAYEQQRRTPIVNQAQRFMIDHSKEHAIMTERSR